MNLDFTISHHARQQLQRRFPNTVLPPRDLENLRVPRSSIALGCIPKEESSFYLIPGLPLVAVVKNDVVVTFEPLDYAIQNVSYRGFLFSDGKDAA